MLPGRSGRRRAIRDLRRRRRATRIVGRKPITAVRAPVVKVSYEIKLRRYAELARRYRRILAQDHMRVVAVRTPDGELEGREPTQLFVRRLDTGTH
jgi:hypothetical protein